MLVLRWNQRAHYWFLGRPKGHIRGTKGTVPFGKGLARTLVATMLKICSFSSPRSSLLHLDCDIRGGMDLHRQYAGFSPASKSYLSQNIGMAVTGSARPAPPPQKVVHFWKKKCSTQWNYFPLLFALHSMASILSIRFPRLWHRTDWFDWFPRVKTLQM